MHVNTNLAFNVNYKTSVKCIDCENGIKIGSFLTKLQTKISRLVYTASSVL